MNEEIYLNILCKEEDTRRPSINDGVNYTPITEAFLMKCEDSGPHPESPDQKEDNNQQAEVIQGMKAELRQLRREVKTLTEQRLRLLELVEKLDRLLVQVGHLWKGILYRL